MLEFYKHVRDALDEKEWDVDVKLSGIRSALGRHRTEDLIQLERDLYTNIHRVAGSETFANDSDRLEVIRHYVDSFEVSFKQIEDVLKEDTPEPEQQTMTGMVLSRWDEETELRIIAVNAAVRYRFGNLAENAHKIEHFIKTGSFEADGSVPIGYGFDRLTDGEVKADILRTAADSLEQEFGNSDCVTWLKHLASRAEKGMP